MIGRSDATPYGARGPLGDIPDGKRPERADRVLFPDPRGSSGGWAAPETDDSTGFEPFDIVGWDEV